MKRRNFLLSLPLIGIAAKAVAEFPFVKRPVGLSGHAVIFDGNEKDVQKYPKDDGYHWSEYGTQSIPVGVVKEVKKSGYRTYNVVVEMKMHVSMVSNLIRFKQGGTARVIEHQYPFPNDYTHILRVRAVNKKSLKIAQGDEFIVCLSLYPENGTIMVEKDSEIHKILKDHPHNADNKKRNPIFREVTEPGVTFPLSDEMRKLLDK